ncbi:hypothetical protein AX14_010028 [Amanita brunnescens Koide BX004]|nr:hypothetical protein AX14_010028 [Amanita brunnescens Koide BX004]
MSIQKELLKRLKFKAYGDAPLNVNEHVWQAIVDWEKSSKSTGQTELDVQEGKTDEEQLEEKLEEDWPEQECNPWTISDRSKTRIRTRTLTFYLTAQVTAQVGFIHQWREYYIGVTSRFEGYRAFAGGDSCQ